MKHHLNRRVVLDLEPKHKNLYPWSLQELDEAGAQLGRDLIPWEWGLHFTATEMSFGDSIVVERNYNLDNDDSKIVTRQRRHLRAKLRPGNTDEWRPSRQTTYSMIGTDRRIDAFELYIVALESGEDEGRCRAWGSVSYTTNFDFRDETDDDTIIFHFYVTPERFEHYAEEVKAGQVDQAVLYISGVKGFYSDWSPAISTDRIKVLTNQTKDHPVEVPDVSDIDPPRLGEVGEASFTTFRKLTLEHPVSEPADDGDNWLGDNDLAETPPDKVMLAAQASAKANAQTVALLTSLRTVAWAIAALLLLILMT